MSKAFWEISRVLKEKGKFVLFTTLPEQTANYWLTNYFPKMMHDSVEQLPSLSAIENALTAANLRIEKMENYFVRDDLQDHFLYCGKNRPELYLSENIRNGISSFSSLANKDEVRNGLQELADDIKKGKISEIIKNYKNDKGDYVFIIIKKV